jgi:hypothetical protein
MKVFPILIIHTVDQKSKDDGANKQARDTLDMEQTLTEVNIQLFRTLHIFLLIG